MLWTHLLSPMDVRGPSKKYFEMIPHICVNGNDFIIFWVADLIKPPSSSDYAFIIHCINGCHELVSHCAIVIVPK